MEQNSNIITISQDELDLTHTLTPGQSFRWKEDELGRWTGVVRGRLIRIWRTGSDIQFEILPHDGGREFIEDYFRLNIKLDGLYKNFIQADPRMTDIIERFKGLRILRQDPEETLLSYICSAANSVSRISTAVERISKEHGKYIATVDGKEYYSFPSAESLANMDINRTAGICGLGFRCENLCGVAQQIIDRPEGWLDSLRSASYEEARSELLSIRGVGMKIADCVLLFSMDKDQAFPVDTHIRKVAVRYYLPEFKQKTLTHAVYQQIVEYFQNKYGPYAGWAQEYLFYDDLLWRKEQKEVI
ncbi:MAG: DNA glycosylase [Armatimonadota bacterium]